MNTPVQNASLPMPAPGKVYTLHPGDVVCAEQGDRLETLLGSCVAIVLTDRRRTIGVMCHFVHCRPAPADSPDPGTYADAALGAMYHLLSTRGLTPKLCDAFVYGGGNMFPDLFTQAHVGDENIRWALNALASDGVNVLLHDYGGSTYRRLSWTVGFDAPQVIRLSV